MSPITFAIWVLMGLLGGLLAGFVTKRGGYGRRGDVLVGLVGSLGAGGFCWALGVSRGLVAVVITFAGAAMVIALQRWRWPASGGRVADGAAPRRGSRPVWGVERKARADAGDKGFGGRPPFSPEAHANAPRRHR